MRKAATRSEHPVAAAIRIAFGVIFLWSSGVHVGIVASDPELYRDVADAAWLPGIDTAWQDIFMAHPTFWGLMIAVGELAIGSALLTGGRLARYGLAGAAAFHLGLMTLGWGYWMWSVPVLVILLGPGRRAAPPTVPTHDQIAGAFDHDLLTSSGPRGS
jgi:hypothetical protein